METQTYRIAQNHLIARDLMAPKTVRMTHGQARPISRRSATDLARRVLQTDPHPIDAAWAAAYLKRDVHVSLDAQRLDPAVLDVVDRRRAWQFQVLPLRRERGVLLLVTTERSLVRAARFARHVCSEPAVVLVADETRFRQFLSAYYPFPGAEDALG